MLRDWIARVWFFRKYELPQSARLQDQKIMGELVHGRSKYTDEDRRRAVIEYHVSGLMTKVSDVTGIPETTLATWKNQSDWWDDLVVSVRNETKDIILAQNLTNARASGDALADRIANGDQKLVKVKKAIKHDDGSVEMTEDYELRAEPMKGRDLAIVTGITQDKATRDMGLPTQIHAQTTDAQIKSFVDEFRQISRSFTEKQTKVVSTQ